MRKIIVCILVGLCFLSSKVSAEELTWGSCTTYAPMPVLFIHGINANSLTWGTATEELEKYFGYRWKQLGKEQEWITPTPPGHPVTYDEKNENAPQNKVVKHYLEAFDYGGEAKGIIIPACEGSFYHIGSNYGTLATKIREILQAYYGDNWEDNPNAKINIIAHSQGGLVARDYIQKKVGEGKDPKVKRLVTIGTPHLGSGLATAAKITHDVHPLALIHFGWQVVALRTAMEIIPQVRYAKLGAIEDMRPNSMFLIALNAKPNVEKEKDVEHVAIAGVLPSIWGFLGDGVVGKESQLGKGVLDDYLIGTTTVKGAHHLNQTNQWETFRWALDGISDKGTKTYDTPRITLGSWTINTGTYSLYSKTPANDFYITGKIYDYLPATCTVTVEIDNPGNYASDKDGKIQDRALILPINMLTETQEEPKTKNLLNAKFNFHPINPLSAGSHTFRLTITNPGSITGTATTEDDNDWIPFEITGSVVEVPIQKTASPATLVAGGFQAASSLFFWDNQNNYWERWINSNLRVDSDNIIRYNAGTSNLDNPNLRHRVYLESRIYPAGAMQPKASCVNKKETNQAITYTFASQPFKLLPYTKEDGSVVYRPDVNEDGTITYPADTVTFINNEVVFAPKKEALPNLSFGPIVPGNPMYTYPLNINIPPTYNGVSSNQLDTYINQVGALYSLEAVQKGYDYAKSLSGKPEFNPTINIAYVQNADLTSDGITCFGSNTAGIYRLLVNGDRKDEYNEDKCVQAYGNALLTHYTGRRYGQGYADSKLPIAPISYTMSAEQSFVDGFCMRFSSAVRGTSIVELPVQQKGVTLDLSQSTHRGTTSALAVAQAISRIPMGKIWQALESPTITLNHSGYTVIDLLDELDAQGYNTTALRTEFFATTQPFTPPQLGSGSVAPETGTAGTTFTFRVRYQDESGREPKHLALCLEGTELRRVNADEYDWLFEFVGQKPEYTKEIEGSPFALTLVDGTITTGAVYEAKVRLTKADTYTYWFDSVDSLGGTLTTTQSQFKVSPSGFNRLDITPSSAVLVINNEVEFEVRGFDEFGNEVEVVSSQWSVVSGIGSLSATSGSQTTFIAGNTPGTATILCEFLIPHLSSLIPLEIVSKGPVSIKGGEVSGRWTKGGSPYIITDNIYIPRGKTLQIDPGVTVKFHSYLAKWNDPNLDWLFPPEVVRRKLTVEGKLIAEGTVQEPIIFTPTTDGGTNTIPNGNITPCFGDWDKIIFESGSTGRLKYCQIKYGGHSDWWYYSIISIEPAVLIKSNDVQMSNCLVTDRGGSARRSSQQQGQGIVIDGVQGSRFTVHGSEIEDCWGGVVVKNSSEVQINNNTVRDDGSFGMQVVNSSGIAFLTNTVTGCHDAAFSQDLASSEIEYRGNTAVGNDFDLIWLAGNFPEGKEVTLKKASLPYGFNFLTIPQGATLRIEPGAKFTLTRLGHIDEEIRDVGHMEVYGRLIAEGTPEEEIVFDKGGFGYWNWIKFIGPNASASSLKYCQIIGGGKRDSSSYIGESSVFTGALWLINSLPKIEYCRILDTKPADSGWDCGIRLQDLPAGYVLANNTFSNCTKAIATYNCPYPPLIASNTLTNNTYCFYQEPNSFPEYHGNTFKDNDYTVILTGGSPRVYAVGVSEIWVFNGCEITLPKATWKEAGLPYAIDGYIRVNKGSTLMIEPGVIIKPINRGIPGGGIIDVQGELIAQGSPQAKIVFTSINDDTQHTPKIADWSSLNFYEGSRGTLTDCVVKYGGGIRINKVNVSISDCLVTQNGDYGIYINNGSPTITNTTVSSNQVYGGIVCDNYSTPIIQNGTISDNGTKTAVDNYGIVCKNYSNAVITNNVISGNYGAGVVQDVNSFPKYEGNKLFGNKYDVGIIGGEMKVNGTWTNLGTQTTYVFLDRGGNVVEDVVVKEGVTLEIEPGIIIKPYSTRGQGLYDWGWYPGGILVRGKLLAQGTKEKPIVFTSFFDDSYGGDTNGDGKDFDPKQNNPGWHGIMFENNGDGIMSQCVVRFGVWNGANIGINSVSPTITIRDCYLSKGAGCGMYLMGGAKPVIENSIITDNPIGLNLNNASPIISTCTISYNSLKGIICDNYSCPIIQNSTISHNGSQTTEPYGLLCRTYSNPLISNNEISYNGEYGVVQDVNSFPVYEGNKLFGNKYDVGIIGGEMKVNGTWTNLGTQTVYVLLYNDVVVKEGVTLGIEPGIIIKPYSKLTPGGYDWDWIPGGILVKGRLLAQGTKEKPIVFTSFFDDSYGGDTNGDGKDFDPTKNNPYWHGVRFENNGDGIMSQCVVRFGVWNGANIGINSVSPTITIRDCYLSKGAGCGMYLMGGAKPVIENSIITDNPIGLNLNNASPIISTCTISYNSLKGIICDNYSSPTIQNSTISHNGNQTEQYGILCRGYSNPLISNNEISYNGEYGLVQDANSFPKYEGNKIFGNKYDAIGVGVYPNEMTVNGTWTNLGTQTVYILLRRVSIKQGVTLRIEPGVIVKPYPGEGIYVNGKLFAQGTKEKPIVFTSFFDDSYGGDTNNDGKDFNPKENNPYWSGVMFENARGSIMENCVVRYADNNIYILSSALSIRHCYISDSTGYGIFLTGEMSDDKVVIENNIITKNLGGIAGGEGYADIRCQNNFIYDNPKFALHYYPTIPMTITVTHNWWGHPSGPNYQNNPNGKGNKIEGNQVIFDPWTGKDFVITPNSGTVGSLVSISGSGLEPSISLGILFGLTGTISWTTTDASGSFTGSFTVPVEKAGKKEISFLYPQIGKGITGKMVLSYFTLLSEELDYLTITPDFITIGCGGSYDFEVQGYDKWGNSLPNLAYQWQITPQLGTISPTTGYWTILKAATTATTGTLTATSGSITMTSIITLSAQPPQYPMTGTIVYLQGEKNKGEIWIMKGDGSQRQKVNIQQTKATYYPKLSKDGQFLVYGAGNEEWVGYQYCHNLMTGSERLVFGRSDILLAKGWDWNTKGDRIYLHFYDCYGDYHSSPAVFYASADGKESKELNTRNYFPGVNVHENLLVSRSGKAIVLYDLIRSKNDTWIENERNIVYEAKDDTEARFSPDDRRIGYIDNVGENLWLTSIDGKIRRRVTNNGSVTCFSFSPDGKQIIFSRQGDLWVINLDGTGERNITNTPEQERQVDWVGGLAPIFTPNIPQPAPMPVPTQGFAEDLTGAFVYPNPTDGKKLIFAELTQNVRIRVFTVVGEEVFDTEVAEPNKPEQGKWEWNCRGSQGQRLASGIYIYLLTNDKGQKKSGKVGIVR